MTVLLKTIGWAVEAKIKVIGGSRPSIVGRELMSSHGLQLIQKTPGENLTSIQREQDGEEMTEAETPLDLWQHDFSKQFNSIFR